MASPDFSAIKGVFSNRNYVIYIAGNSFSLIGLWVQRVAVGWLAWELTGSGSWLGAIAFADLFPTMFLSLVAGVIADRVDRRVILLVGQTLSAIQAAVLCTLTYLGLMTIELLFGLALLQGMVNALNQPARMALLPSLVRPRDLSSAVAVGSVTFNLARFLGPMVAGIIISAYGTAPAFGVNSVSYLTMILALVYIRLSPLGTEADERTGIFRQLLEGLRYASGHPGIGPILILIGFVGFLGRPVFDLLPGFADAVFHEGASGLAILNSAAGLGSIVGGLWLAQRGSVAGLVMIFIRIGVLSGVAIVLFAQTTLFIAAVPAMVAAGLAFVVAGVGSQTLIQTTVDERMRGRVMSIWSLIFVGGDALGVLVMGSLSDVFGFHWPLTVGALVLVGAMLVSLNWRRRLIEIFETGGPGSSELREAPAAARPGEVPPVQAAAREGS